MRLLLLIIVCALLAGSTLPLAVAPPPPPPRATLACPAPAYADAAALLAALPAADYACAEDLAAALRPRADQPTAAALLAMARAGTDTRARRNALRALGRLAESPRGSHPRELVLRAHGAALQSLAVAILSSERDNFLLQDAVWLLDTFFYPSLGAAPALEHVAHAPELAPALRYRAAAARARLILARPGPLAPADQAFILAGLRAADPGLRTAAATAVAHLRPAQQGAATELAAALAAAWAAEPPLALASDALDPRALSQLSFQESSPTSLSARAAFARARDQLAGGATAHLDELHAAYEALALPHSLSGDGIRLRSGLPPAQLPALLAELERARAAFAQIVGPELALPLPGAGQRPLTVLIFARQGIYRDYMRAFTPFSVDVDGIYDELTATLYSHQRTAEQSEHTLPATLRHELAHHQAATTLFPGHWRSRSYHAEPKGWADEGLAELLAGLGAASPAPRPTQLARLCARPHLPPLAALLARREGYDQFGSFDYEAAWALSLYLYQQQPAALRQLYGAYRDGSYRLARWEAIAGLSLAQVEAEWHAAIGGWCGRDA